jgi:uncharacterized protein
MQIDLTQLPEGTTRLEADVEPGSVGITPEDAAVDGNLGLELLLDRRGDEIWIRGKVHLVAREECSRCLAEYPETLDLDFDVFCAKVQNPNVVSRKAVDEEDGGVHFHDGKVLTIDDEIREAVILGLPMKPLCKESCAGLCPRCGEDRNEGPCRCARAAAG